ncbi:MULTISPECIES: DUF2782 domain-containing protein [Lysobacter]|uniref:DUF2782 domain-containing protein n=1 Tax=Lysobacter enzymogenes TaxID=69 RepID=A0A0S2DP19_LYSEN|nr:MULTISPECIES: DUF2782 domain-containing protein [Lysobacter]ALN60282.1 lipoprotein [Lysobacter enzymogenes]ROU08398.1 DUF2782 domain-containing protein [Lysobacter enzymogenes]UZW61017.1 DUF2782 domain-containing protein [Lysobacter enzymogenes]SDZ13492.1 Protein of unknown function [Lysobacter sp. yr284]
MRAPHAPRAAFAAALLALALAGCASTGGAANAADPTAGLSNAEVRTRTVENGDTIEEYRVAGQLRVVKVVPARGPTYYLVDENGDGRLDASKGEGTVSPVYFKLFSW